MHCQPQTLPAMLPYSQGPQSLSQFGTCVPNTDESVLGEEQRQPLLAKAGISHQRRDTHLGRLRQRATVAAEIPYCSLTDPGPER